MINSKFSEYAPLNSASEFPSSNKQQPKKTALRDLENGNRVMLSNHSGSPPFLKYRGPIMETSMVSGIERPMTESPHSSLCGESPSSGANGHLVYARRKSEQEVTKGNNSVKEKNTDCPEQSQQAEKMSHRQAQSVSAARPYLSAFTPVSVTSPMVISGGTSLFPAKPRIELSSGEPNDGTYDSVVSLPGNLQRMNGQHWKERFLKLQTHLRNRDLSSDQEYIKMLQRLTPADRSKHAVELEKRAIRLLLEEGHELMRMKHLNVLGKSVPTNHAPPLTKRFKTEE